MRKNPQYNIDLSSLFIWHILYLFKPVRSCLIQTQDCRCKYTKMHWNGVQCLSKPILVIKIQLIHLLSLEITKPKTDYNIKSELNYMPLKPPVKIYGKLAIAICYDHCGIIWVPSFILLLTTCWIDVGHAINVYHFGKNLEALLSIFSFRKGHEVSALDLLNWRNCFK